MDHHSSLGEMADWGRCIQHVSESRLVQDGLLKPEVNKGIREGNVVNSVPTNRMNPIQIQTRRSRQPAMCEGTAVIHMMCHLEKEEMG